MERKYRSSNIRFNMSDSIQSRAWEYLQSQKGCASYGRLISEAIVKMMEADSNSVADSYFDGEISLSANTIEQIVSAIITGIDKSDVTISLANTSHSDTSEEECISEEMSGFLFG